MCRELGSALSLFTLFLAATLSIDPACAQATGPAANFAEYDSAVARVWGHIVSTAAVVEWCTRNVVPKESVEQAYEEWTAGFAPLIADIDRRVDLVMNRSGNYTAAQLAAKKAELLQRGARKFADDVATASAEEAKQNCAALPGYFRTGSFNLETLFARELALIRAAK
jgi:hypothetical protein